MQNNWIGVFDRWYIACMVSIASVIIYLNWHAQNMVGLLSGYQHYKAIIQQNFTHHTLITFPLWGYGWLMLITESKLGLLTIQIGLALGALYFFVRFLEQEQIFSVRSIRFFKVCVVFSLPWYAFHALLWPYSIASSLFLVSLALLYKAVTHTKNSWVNILLSAVWFGLLLNFRSDYFLMPLGFSVLLVLFFRSKRSCLQIGVWLVTLYGCLIPWAFYTKKACGHCLLTSTNGGHVAFIGLGHDTHNPWGITVSDADPVMHSIVDKHFKTQCHSTLDYEADQLLKRTFLEYVTAYPWDYVRKCAKSLLLVVTQGFYPGDFLLEADGAIPFGQPRVRDVVLLVLKNPLLLVSEPATVFRVLLTACSYGAGIILLLTSYLLSPVTLFVAFRERSLFMLCILAAIAYQTLINVLTQNAPSYVSNLYIFYLLNVLYGISLLRAFFLHYKRVMRPYRNPFKIVF